MAIASCSVKIISRGKGRSAVAAAAYRAGQEMHNKYDRILHDFTRKRGIIHAEILTPVNAPDWARDRQQLWNRVELTERRKDARLAREVMIALPRELSPDQNVELVRAYARTFVEQGMIADVTVHDTGDGNPHAHIMLTTRALDGNELSKKKNRDWDSTDSLIEWRKAYEDITNRYLERYGHEKRIDVRSYEAQGVDLLPTVHLRPHAHRMEQRGIPTERGDINREVEKHNEQIREIVKEITLLELEMEHLQSEGFNLVKHYKKAKDEIQKTAEELANRLTENGRDILTEQKRIIENALGQLQKQTQGHETSAPHAPVDEPSQQRRLSFDELYQVPTPAPQPHPEQPRSQEGSSPPKRPPPLRRHREDRHLAQERRNVQGQREPSHHALAEEAERRRRAEYDRLYEEPLTNQAQEPKHHSHASTRGKGRKMDYSRVYKKPTDGNNEHRQSERNRDGPERDM